MALNLLRTVALLLTGLVLPGLSACKKEANEQVGLSLIGGLPYYHFTDNDRLWLQARHDEIWRVENGRGQQRAYRISVSEHLKRGDYSYSTGIPGSSQLLGYYDHSTVRANRIDTLSAGVRGYFDLRFYRDAAMRTNLSSGGYDKYASQFYANGEFYEFVGNTDLVSDYYSCRGLKFPRGASLNGPFQQLTVRGRQYNDVVVFTGTSRGPNCTPVSSSYMQALYYDRRAGLVRMVSLAGEVWERVP